MQVLNNGEMLEFERPAVLLSNPKSYFVALVEQTGPAEAEYLRTLARRINTTRKEENDVDDQPILSENDPLLI